MKKVFPIIAFLVFVLGCIYAIYKILDFSRNRCIQNPPSIVYIEEDLEELFLTRSVTVIDYEEDAETIVYTVSANGIFYKVLYKVTPSLGSFIWRYDRHIQIKMEG